MKTLNANKGSLKLLLIIVFLFVCVNFSFAQIVPQQTLTVTATQEIQFGTFCIKGKSGGTITVGYDGRRTSTGDIVLLSLAPIAQPAIYEIKLCQGRNISVTFDATTPLTASDGRALTLEIGPTEKGPSGSIFSTNGDCNFITSLRVGGTLHIPGTALPGTYTNNFAITFINKE